MWIMHCDGSYKKRKFQSKLLQKWKTFESLQNPEYFVPCMGRHLCCMHSDYTPSSIQVVQTVNEHLVVSPHKSLETHINTLIHDQNTPSEQTAVRLPFSIPHTTKVLGIENYPSASMSSCFDDLAQLLLCLDF